MGWGVPEARRQCYNSPMNSDLSGRRRTTTTRHKMPFLGRTLCRGPTKTPCVCSLLVLDQMSLLTQGTEIKSFCLWKKLRMNIGISTSQNSYLFYIIQWLIVDYWKHLTPWQILKHKICCIISCHGNSARCMIFQAPQIKPNWNLLGVV